VEPPPELELPLDPEEGPPPPEPEQPTTAMSAAITSVFICFPENKVRGLPTSEARIMRASMVPIGGQRPERLQRESLMALLVCHCKSNTPRAPKTSHSCGPCFSGVSSGR
jgi:hypothetical protein